MAGSIVVAAGRPQLAASLSGDDPAAWVERAGPASGPRASTSAACAAPWTSCSRPTNAGHILFATGAEVVDGRIVRITSVLDPDKLAATERPSSSLE